VSAERAPLVEQDREARRRSRHDFDRPVILEAGAGTGKTEALTARVVSWCLVPGWERNAAVLRVEHGAEADAESVAARVLERVTALTFTERAAAEMAERVALVLAQAHHGESPQGLPLEELTLTAEERSTRAAALLAALDRLCVGTIHAFCRRLLSAHALEADLHPAFEVDAEGRGVRRVVEEVLRERMVAMYGDPGDERALALAQEGLGPDALGEALQVLAQAGVPPAALDEQPDEAQRLDAATARLLARTERVLDRIRRPVLRSFSGRLRKARETLGALEALTRRLQTASRVEELVLAAQDDALSAAAGRLERWSRGELTQTEAVCFGAAREGLAVDCRQLLLSQRHLQALRPASLELAKRVLGPLLEEIARRLRAQGIETFTALLRDTRDLLRRDATVRARVRQGIDQILVDEFQDTDPVQCEIIRALALGGDAGQRPGLFLVGDPKQSIYGWRSADLAAYDAFIGEVQAAGGVRLSLGANFRSTAAILAEVERIAAPVMTREEGVQPPFQPLIAAAALTDEQLTGGRRPVEHWISWASPEPGTPHGPRTPAERAREIEAVAVARDLVELQRTTGLCWGRAAILLRATSYLETYLQPLREAHIPFVVERDRSYYRRREVIDASTTLRAVIDPSDQVALLGFLRSVVVGVPDAALIPLWRQRLPEIVAGLRERDERQLALLDEAIARAAAEVPAGCAALDRVEGWPAALRAALRSLAELRRSFAADAADRFVERLRATLLVEETEAARFLGAHRLANLERFFRRLLRALIQGEGGPHSLLRELRAGVAEAREEEEGAVGDETLDAVRVLTMHKAKGLTFDHIYVVGLHSETGRKSSDDACEAVEHEDRWELRLFGAASLDFDRVEERRDQVAAAEAVRTLYVAATRPRRRLVLAGCWPGVGDRALPAGIPTHIDLLRRRRGDRPELEELFDERRADEVRDDVRWFFPDLVGRSAVSIAGKERGVVLTPQQARREAEQLAQQQRQAAERQARRRCATASASAHGALREARLDVSDEVEARASPADRSLGLTVGTVVHGVLERFDLRADATAELARQRQRAQDDLRELVSAAELPAASAAATALLDRLAGSELLRRLRQLDGAIIGRELPLLLAADDEQAVGAVIGTIDLLYRDATTGQLVVADYKTDRVDAQRLRERAATYRGQGEVYLEAVRRALGVSPAPRFELWFLQADQIVDVGGE
jgi:ATP-dependent helicase/nuclease subunit A